MAVDREIRASVNQPIDAKAEHRITVGDLVKDLMEHVERDVGGQPLVGVERQEHERGQDEQRKPNGYGLDLTRQRIFPGLESLQEPFLA